MIKLVASRLALGTVIGVAAVAALTFWGASLLAEELYERLDEKPKGDG